MKVGQPVWYFTNVGAEPAAAIVTEVYGDEMVDIMIDQAGAISARGNVPILNGPAPRDGWVEEPHTKDRPNVAAIVAYTRTHRPPESKLPTPQVEEVEQPKAVDAEPPKKVHKVK